MKVHHFYEKMHNKSPFHKTVIVYSTVAVFMVFVVFAGVLNWKANLSSDDSSVVVEKTIVEKTKPKSIFDNLKNIFNNNNNLLDFKNQNANVLSATNIKPESQDTLPADFYEKEIIKLTPTEN